MNRKKTLPEIRYNRLLNCIKSCVTIIQLDNFYNMRIAPHVSEHPENNGLIADVFLKRTELEQPKTESFADEQDTIYMKIINRNQK